MTRSAHLQNSRSCRGSWCAVVGNTKSGTNTSEPLSGPWCTKSTRPMCLQHYRYWPVFLIVVHCSHIIKLCWQLSTRGGHGGEGWSEGWLCFTKLQQCYETSGKGRNISIMLTQHGQCRSVDRLNTQQCALGVSCYWATGASEQKTTDLHSPKTKTPLLLIIQQIQQLYSTHELCCLVKFVTFLSCLHPGHEEYHELFQSFRMRLKATNKKLQPCSLPK